MMENIKKMFDCLMKFMVKLSEWWFSLNKAMQILLLLITLLIFIWMFGNFAIIFGIFLAVWLAIKVAAWSEELGLGTSPSRPYRRLSTEEKKQVIDALHEDPTRTHRIISDLLGIPKSTVSDILKKSIVAEGNKDNKNE